MSPENQDALRCAKELELFHTDATPGKWGKGRTTHETVAKQPDGEQYHVADFRHATDAAFADAAHREAPAIAAHLRRLVAENEAMLVGLRNRDDWLEQKSKRLIAATALMQQMLEAGKELNRFYSHIWDRVDGCAVIFPNSIPAFENAVEKHGEAITAAREWLEGK